MARLNFIPQSARKQPLRTAPSKFLTSKLRGIFERSEGIRLAETFYPYRYLPVCFQDVETEDWVVIPKGRIVSTWSQFPRLNIGDFALGGGTASTIKASGVPEPFASGMIYTYDNALTSATDYQKTMIDTSYWGYRNHTAAVLIPANDIVSGLGGTYHYYSADDVTAGTLTVSGTAAVANGPVLMPAAHPVGVVAADVYQDIRGKYLNYQLWDDVGILCDWYVEIPFVNATKFLNYVSGTVTAFVNSETPDYEAVTNAYPSVFKKHTFLWFFDNAVHADPLAVAGAYVGPDKYGNYKILESGGPRAEQERVPFLNVGKLVLLDSRFPKDMLELVDTYPGSSMPGTDTGGLPAFLYTFVYDALKAATGSAPAIKTVVSSVQDGTFGVARVNLHVS